MADTPKDPRRGPDAMWDRELAPTRGQHASIAVLACDLLGIPLESRYDATVAIGRLAEAVRLKEDTPNTPSAELIRRLTVAR